ncbi:MAG TPA: hypothetical protein PK079_17455 [Leptospiraceae bacterium]|nr:hypothetical protein [Leptospiraceae bacterium]HMW06464.1 hypothetical protein [Leptospiraceae bacterium]HMX32434.1 hypothetical protein [Leptospiraceae bacterium]HMY33677.1 hypothetical protein [Leptospiraceae bacterium]HMZ65228.1 hypothetical protein [Leptospiraceae bacterium]
MIHHLAIATTNVLKMAEFYKTLPGLNWKEDKFTVDGSLRSVWFDTANGCLLMLEKFPYSKAPEALIFQFEPHFNFTDIGLTIIKRTDYTFYFNDPDGNQLGYSSYPNKLKF